MSGNASRSHRRVQGCLSFLIGALVIAAAVLIGAIVVTDYLDRTKKTPPTVDADGAYINIDEVSSSDYQMIISKPDEPSQDDASVPAGVAVAYLTPVPTATPEPTFDPEHPYALVRPTPAAENLLPVFKKANTKEKRIAITLDECSGSTITSNIIKLAQYYDAKLTLFPSGENILKTGMDTLLRQCVEEWGFEIENRCYSTINRLYQLDDVQMCEEIWKQSMAVNYVLNAHYQPHFLRLYGNNGVTDARTHAYLMQEGYIGIASWTLSSDATAEKLVNSLSPGNIYEFKTTEKDAAKMGELLRAAKSAGYEMVTLNELFGYDANEMTPVEGSLTAEIMPLLENYSGDYYLNKVGDCSWASKQIQERLIELGYLPEGSADGMFGNGTASALSAFQAKCDLAATGAADEETQRRLFAEDAPAQVQPKGQDQES